jgi:hypothetical protein
VWEEAWIAAPYEARVDSDLKAISVEDGVSNVVWVGADNSLETNTSHSVKCKATKITGSGTVQVGSPLGLYTRAEKSFSVSYVNSAGELVALDYEKSA